MVPFRVLAYLYSLIMVSIMAVIIEVCNIKIQMQISYIYIIFLLQLFLQTFMYSVRSWHETNILLELGVC